MAREIVVILGNTKAESMLFETAHMAPNRNLAQNTWASLVAMTAALEYGCAFRNPAPREISKPLKRNSGLGFIFLT